MSKDNAAREIANLCETSAQAAIASRGPVPIVQRGPGRTRALTLVGADGKTKGLVTHADVLRGLIAKEGIRAEVIGKGWPAKELAELVRPILAPRETPIRPGDLLAAMGLPDTAQGRLEIDAAVRVLGWTRPSTTEAYRPKRGFVRRLSPAKIASEKQRIADFAEAKGFSSEWAERVCAARLGS